ncbi:MAG: VTT domain-containing protein [Acidobacteria bacterium]|nr:VTT domain-containing protein [Acidobacteriota bacterium]
MPAPHHILAETIHFVERHGYALLFGWVLAEQGAVPLPSIPVLVAAGWLARTGRLQAGVAAACCVTAALLADSLWFCLGRRRGPGVLRWICRISLEPDSCVRRTEDAFLRYGMRSLLVSKFVPGLNAVAAPLAGSSGASIGRFLLYDAAGAILWCGAYLALGYVFGEQLEPALQWVAGAGSWLLALLAVVPGLWIGWKFAQRRRFLRDLSVARITPEELRGLLDAGETPYIVDLRSGMDTEPSPIPNSVRISVQELGAGRHAIPRDREIILFCT